MLDPAKALLVAAERTRWHADVALSLVVGIRTEARALRWDHMVTWWTMTRPDRSPSPRQDSMALDQ
jgi:hypothetical protein